jgi:hypothetical protein
LTRTLTYNFSLNLIYLGKKYTMNSYQKNWNVSYFVLFCFFEIYLLAQIVNWNKKKYINSTYKGFNLFIFMIV